MLNGAASERTQRSFTRGSPRGLLGGWPDSSSLNFEARLDVSQSGYLTLVI